MLTPVHISRLGRLLTVMGAVHVLFISSALAQTAVWTRSATTGPPARYEASLAYDSARGRTILFGGHAASGLLSDTWEWDGNVWKPVATTGPSARYGASMVYDSGRGRTVLFGGRDGNSLFADTWEWDGGAWTRTTISGPPGRCRASMAYDSARGKTVLFGGSALSFFRSDTWEWDGTSWKQVASTGPSAREGAPMAYDSARGRAVVALGWNGNSYPPDTWEWDGSMWRQVATSGPSGRNVASMTYDSARRKSVLYGGDTWEWDGGTWKQVATSGPPGRWGAGMAYDGARGTSVLFGGNSGGAILFDTWEYSDAFLVFRSQPTTGYAALPLPTQPVVEVRRRDSTVITGFAEQVTIALKSGAGAPGAVLGGTTTVQAVNGGAAFSGLTIDRKGTGYVLVATCGTLLPVESLPFDVAPTPAGIPVTKRVSIGYDGTKANGQSTEPAISADGQYVAFWSLASNIIPNDTSYGWDVYLWDRITGKNELVSLTAAGNQWAGQSANGTDSISGDGRYVAFGSFLDILVPDDTNGADDVYVRDRVAKTTELVSRASDGTPGDDSSWTPDISADGRYVAFSSNATNLAPGPTYGYGSIFVRDRQAGLTERASASNFGGGVGYGDVYYPSISADGRYVAFQSSASNLVDGDTNGQPDVFVRDRVTSVTERVSVSSSGAQGNRASYRPRISANGRFVVFESVASNFVPNDQYGYRDIFVRDRAAATTERVSVASDGTQANNDCDNASLSGDGRFVAFESLAKNLVPGNVPSYWTLYLRDRQTGQTSLISAAPDGSSGDGSSTEARLSTNGQYVAFFSTATNLVADNLAGYAYGDVFVRGPLFIPAAPFMASDVETALRIVAGFASPTNDAWPRYNVEFSGPSAGRIDLADVLRIARKVGGLEPNP